jgi:O-antigen ligase
MADIVMELLQPETFLIVVAVAVCMLFGACIFVVLRDGPLRPGRAASTLVTLVALFSIVLMRAPHAVGYTAVEGFVMLVPFAFAIAWMLRQPRQRADRPIVLLIASFIALVTIALYRGKQAGVGTGGIKDIAAQVGSLVAVSMFGLLLFTTARSKAETWRRLIAVALAPSVYIGLNILLYFAGFAPAVDPNAVSLASGHPAKTLALIGVHIDRVAFAMNPSVNGMGVIAAVGLAAATMLALRTEGRERKLGVAGAATCLLGLLLADTRAALFLAILVVVLLSVVKRTKIAVLLAVAIPFSPWVIRATLYVLSSTGLAAPLSRNANNIATGGARVYIWQGAEHQLEHSSIFHALLGYGANGQVTSGASRLYAYLFAGTPNPLLVHVHNLALQTLLDMGLVGLLLLIATVVMTVARLERISSISPKGPVAALLAAFLMLFLTGSTEPSPTYLTQETLFFAMLLASVSAGLAMQPIEVPSVRRHVHSRDAWSSPPTTAGSGMLPAQLGLNQ